MLHVLVIVLVVMTLVALAPLLAVVVVFLGILGVVYWAIHLSPDMMLIGVAIAAVGVFGTWTGCVYAYESALRKYVKNEDVRLQTSATLSLASLFGLLYIASLF
jgi:hypothetical protein